MAFNTYVSDSSQCIDHWMLALILAMSDMPVRSEFSGKIWQFAISKTNTFVPSVIPPRPSYFNWSETPKLPLSLPCTHSSFFSIRIMITVCPWKARTNDAVESAVPLLHIPESWPPGLPWDRLSWLVFFVPPRIYLELVHDPFLQDPFQFIIHEWSYHSTVHKLQKLMGILK